MTITGLPRMFRRRHFFASLSFLAAGTVLLGLAAVGSPARAETITTASLLDEMTDLAGHGGVPQPAPTPASSSRPTTARRSRPQENWFANGDCGQYLRVEDRAGRKEHVMMDAAGPGAIVRIWSANPAGTLRIYLDGAEQPVVEAPMSEVLGRQAARLAAAHRRRIQQRLEPLLPDSLRQELQGHQRPGRLLLPRELPHLREPARQVESFRPDQIQTLARAHRTAGGAPGRAARQPTRNSAAPRSPFQEELPAGGTLRQEFTGPKAFTRAVVRLDAKDRDAALRGIVLRVTFDGEPCVEAPLGDFFGSAPGINAFAALPLGMTEDGEMYCHWFMPFKESAVLELVNTTQADGERRRRIRLEGLHVDRPLHALPRQVARRSSTCPRGP